MVELNEQQLEQAMGALGKANEIRSARARDKKLILLGRLSPVDLIRDPPDHWLTARVITLLIAMPQVGRYRAGKWLRTEGISPNLELGTMGERNRRALAAHMEPDWRRRFADAA